MIRTDEAGLWRDRQVEYIFHGRYGPDILDLWRGYTMRKESFAMSFSRCKQDMPAQAGGRR